MRNTVTTDRKPRRWPWLVGVAAALVIGVSIGAAGGADTTLTTAPEPDTIVETETVTETVEVEIGGECRAYADWILDQMDAKDAIVLAAFGEMADILDRDGFMTVDEYVDILDRATSDMNALPVTMTSGSGFDCPKP